MSENGGLLEASMVFEKLFTDYLKSQTDAPARKLLLKKLERVKQENPLLAGISIDDDGRVYVNAKEGTEQQVVSALSRAFDELTDVTAFSMGQEEAFRHAETIVNHVMKQFQEPFSRLGVRNHILKGSKAERLPSGIEGLDSMLGGGFPRSDMILVSGPPGMAKFNLGIQFLAQGLRSGGSGIVVLSSMHVKEFREMLAKQDVNISACESKGRLITIDWYSQKSRSIIGMEEHGPILVPSKDIANLDIAFTGAMDGLSFAPTTRAFVDMVTPALSIYELSDVIEFVQRQKARFKDRQVTSMFMVESGVHDDRVMTTLKHVSDAEIALTTDAQNQLFLEIEAMSQPNFRKGKSAIQLSYRGISIVETAVDEAGVITEFCNIPMVSREIARKLVDAGFSNMSQLSRADESDLLKVPLLNRDIARNIMEYTRTVEFSQSVLSSRSDRWLKKAKEQVASGELNKARKSLERALEIDPGNATAQAELVKITKKLETDSSL